MPGAQRRGRAARDGGGGGWGREGELPGRELDGDEGRDGGSGGGAQSSAARGGGTLLGRRSACGTARLTAGLSPQEHYKGEMVKVGVNG